MTIKTREGAEKEREERETEEREGPRSGGTCFHLLPRDPDDGGVASGVLYFGIEMRLDWS